MRVTPPPAPPREIRGSVSVNVQWERRSTDLLLLGVGGRGMCGGTPQCSVFLFVRELLAIV